MKSTPGILSCFAAIEIEILSDQLTELSTKTSKVVIEYACHSESNPPPPLKWPVSMENFSSSRDTQRKVAQRYEGEGN
jgi:hypothetical protein